MRTGPSRRIVTGRRSRAPIAGACLAGAAVAFASVASCGARTGLPRDVVEDASPHEKESGARPDATRDAGPGEDATDARAPEADAADDPPVDNTVPDVIVDQCPDAAATRIYVVTTTSELLSFDPTTNTFASVGPITCVPSGTPFSMAVNRHGVAWVVFESGELYRVSTVTGACQLVKRYVPDQDGFAKYGMGFVAGIPAPDGGADGGADAGEGGAGVVDRLFVADATNPSQLGVVDTTSFKLTNLGAFHPLSLDDVELTGTGDGRLFAYYTTALTTGIAQVDPTNAAVLAEWSVPVPHGTDWAFAFWGGVFYLFTSPGGATVSDVHRFDPADGSTTHVATSPANAVIDGAGVSTCAPLE